MGSSGVVVEWSVEPGVSTCEPVGYADELAADSTGCTSWVSGSDV